METTIKKLQVFNSSDGAVLQITVPRQTENLTDIISQIDDGKRYNLTIKKHKEKRSLNSNAYSWKLIGELAKTLTIKDSRPITADEIYRGYIKEVGIFEIVPIRNDAVDKWLEVWTSRGLGWICETQTSKLENYTNVVSYYGSSVFNQSQMCRLINLIVADCKELNIQTLTPNELEEMNKRWGN